MVGCWWGGVSPSWLPSSADSCELDFCSMTNTSEKYKRTQQGNLLGVTVISVWEGNRRGRRMVIKISTRSPRVKNFLFDYLPTGIQIKNHISACHQIIQFLLRSFCDIAPASVQRPKKSELSGWQLSTRKNFPDEVRKLFLRQKKRVNCFRDKKRCVSLFVRKSA